MTAPASDVANERTSDVSSKHDAGGPARKPPRRNLPRFGLRSLLIFAIAFCLLFGWIGRNLYRMRQEDAAIETLVQAGATINMRHEPDHGDLSGYVLSGDEPLAPLPPSDFARAIGWSSRLPIRGVRLDGDDDSLNAGALDALARLPEIERLVLVYDFDDRAMPALARASGLQDLRLDRTDVTGEGLASLAPHMRLRRLKVETDYSRGVPAAAAKFPDLEWAELQGSEIRREDVAGLSALPHLERLTLWSVFPMRASEEEAIYTPLAQAKGLKRLTIGKSGFTDADAAALAELPQLENLFLDGISDAGLTRLGDHPNLQFLRVEPPVTRQGARQFSAEHPECLVFYHVDPSIPLDPDAAATVGADPNADRSERFRAGEPSDGRRRR